jgi:hypothetical protein
VGAAWTSGLAEARATAGSTGGYVTATAFAGSIDVVGEAIAASMDPIQQLLSTAPDGVPGVTALRLLCSKPAACMRASRALNLTECVASAFALLAREAAEATALPSGTEHLVGLAAKAQSDRLVAIPAIAGDRVQGKIISGQFEAAVAGCLLQGIHGLAPDDVITENQLRALGALGGEVDNSAAADVVELTRRGTPDILLRYPVLLNEQPVHWVECKMGWTLPGVSAPRKVGKLCSQLCRYRDRYGPGLVVWSNGVFSSTASLVDGVQHLSMRP